MYQVLARKWRPQRFDDVIGQQAVTRTLRNAIASGRIAQAFVFAGSRGCGKTTTARILAKALNCEKGPTADPCGVCDACVEIAQGRDIDVLEIDAASHTQVDNIRDVILSGLSVAPVRDRFKIFIIDEVHQLSTHSFNALLKSVEEPPAHVVFMMATTELQKIPDTILSRSQVFEFKTIPTPLIVQQLRRIAEAEGLDASDAALALVARAAEGSMRDAQSALDQVIAFAGTTVAVDDVSTVLGLVGRDLLLDIIEAVLDEDGPRGFALADRAVESGHDLRLVCRELASTVRDLMMVSVDPARAAGEGVSQEEQARLTQLAARFSREDLMRAFDVLAKAEQDIRTASQPRYHFEMALLRWMHLQKLVPLTDLLDQVRSGGGGLSSVKPAAPRAVAAPPARPSPARVIPAARRDAAPGPPASSGASASPRAEGAVAPALASASALKDALLAEIRSAKGFFYNTVVAQAQKIEVAAAGVTFTFLPAHRALRDQFEQTRPWLESVAERLAGRKTAVVSVQADAPAPQEAAPAREAVAPVNGAGADDARTEALSSPVVQALLDVFPAEIRDVEEI